MSLHKCFSRTCPYRCEICGYQCRQRASLNWHMRKHTSEAHFNYTCEHCGKRFEKLDSVKFHKLKSHPDKQPTWKTLKEKTHEYVKRFIKAVEQSVYLAVIAFCALSGVFLWKKNIFVKIKSWYWPKICLIDTQIEEKMTCKNTERHRSRESKQFL